MLLGEKSLSTTKKALHFERFSSNSSKIMNFLEGPVEFFLSVMTLKKRRFN